VIIYTALVLLAIFFALNMGGSNFGASFAAAHGGRIVTKRRAQFLFIVFVFLGAILIGRPVTETLGSRIIPREFIKPDTVLIILFSAALSLFIANRLKVPQSTSFVAIAAILGVGLYFKSVYTATFLYMLPFWVALPVIGYFLTFFLGKIVYPPRRSNFWIYEKLVNNKGRLRAFIIIASCYNAFSVGTNNVANAVGPLAGAGMIDKTLGLILIAPVFGLGSILFHETLDTTGEKIVPLGLFSATIICFVTGTLIIIASAFGVPQSFVMVKVAAVFAVSGLKQGHRITFANPVTKKTYLTWIITPLVALFVSYILTWARYALFG
jgi:sulfate permease